MAIDYALRLSEHFRLREFFDPAKYTNVYNKAARRNYTAEEAEAIAESAPWTVDTKLIKLLEAIRAYYDGPVTLTPHGGYRPQELNAAVGGAAGSQHRHARAADIRVTSRNKLVDAATLAVRAEAIMDQIGVKGGVGVYGANDNYIHVDTRGSNVAWYDSYSSAGCPGQGGRKVTYRKGHRAAGIVLIQRHLKGAGYDCGPIDGYYGTKTAAAVKAFQADRIMDADGVFGPQTSAAMGVLPW